MSKRSVSLLAVILLVFTVVLAACQPTEVVRTVVVTEEVMVEGETVVQEKVITATPAPVEEAPAFLAADSMVPCMPFPEGFEISKPSAQAWDDA